MTKRQKWLLRACQELGIDIKIGYILSLEEGQQINTIAYIPSFGGSKGMLIVRSTDDARAVLNDFNYGIAVLDEPSEKSEFNLEATKEMFIDWGWSGENKKKMEQNNL